MLPIASITRNQDSAKTLQAKLDRTSRQPMPLLVLIHLAQTLPQNSIQSIPILPTCCFSTYMHGNLSLPDLPNFSSARVHTANTEVPFVPRSSSLIVKMSTGENAIFLEQNCDNSLKTCNWLASVEGRRCRPYPFQTRIQWTLTEA